ncbi:alpha-amylase family glycosyl hydrolase [Emticicia agri]|uniref:Alpha-amylase n=1 Tax=Emticicia agri TaxID=2492393 RepID=A0A4Q5LY74_9BACT|nr:alpha-amylase family glycosyl hydrolase [Emticicia agri]RYU94811.1 alpha-amylase [Emticicia agri]
MYKIICFAVLFFYNWAIAQTPTKMTKEKKESEKKTDKLVVYQIYTRLFSNTKTTNKFNGTIKENGCGKFNDINDKALQALKKFGVSHVWYTGVIEHATMTDYSKYGIQKDNPLVVKGMAGSPYAVKDYYDVDPDLAVNVKNRMKEFESLVKRSHKNDLKVVIDFVPNHVARQYHSDVKPPHVKDLGEDDDKLKSFAPNNNFYYIEGQQFVVPENVNPPVKVAEPFIENPAKATGNDVFTSIPSINDWFETVKLNYGIDYLDNRSTHFNPVPNTWLKMKDILLFWASKGIDGFRCDMAEMVPKEFWGWVIPEVKKVNPHLIFIAEIYNPSAYWSYIAEGKFDYLYDKVGLYDGLRRLMQGGGDANDITKVWQNESGNFANQMIRFLENHDEHRICSKFFVGDAFKAIPSMIVSATLHSGPVMLYFGQELGVNPNVAEGFSGDDGRTTIFDYWGVPEFQNWVNDHKYDGGKMTTEQKKIRKFYADLLKFVNTSDAVRNGQFFDLQYVNNNGQAPHYNDQKIFSYLRFTEKQKLLFICNFDLENSYSTAVNIPVGAWEMMKLDPSQKYTFKGVFGNKLVIEEGKADKVKVDIPKNSVLIFEIK